MPDNKEMIVRLNNFIGTMETWINNGEGRITNTYQIVVNQDHLRLVRKMLQVVVLEISESKPDKLEDLEARMKRLESLEDMRSGSVEIKKE